MLLDVPAKGCKGLKYLPNTKVDELQLHTLGYNEEVLLVREEYLIALGALGIKSGTGGGMVITGQPGIGMEFLWATVIWLTSLYIAGKTFFLYYTLLYCLSSGKPTAFQCGHMFLLFDQSGVNEYDSATTKWQFHFKEKIWALSNADGLSQQPCHAFLNFSKMGKVWIVQAGQPSTPAVPYSQSYHWDASSYVMSCFTSTELKALRSVNFTQ